MEQSLVSWSRMSRPFIELTGETPPLLTCHFTIDTMIHLALPLFSPLYINLFNTIPEIATRGFSQRLFSGVISFFNRGNKGKLESIVLALAPALAHFLSSSHTHKAYLQSP